MVHSEELDETFRALSDPTRREILARLMQSETTVSELAEPFDMSLPAVSKHVRVLEAAGLLQKRHEGRSVYCRLDPAPMKVAHGWLENYKSFWTMTLDRLSAYLDEEEES